MFFLRISGGNVNLEVAVRACVCVRACVSPSIQTVIGFEFCFGGFVYKRGNRIMAIRRLSVCVIGQHGNKGKRRAGGKIEASEANK